MQRKIHNQTLFVAALSVYLGLLIVGAPPQVVAQQSKFASILDDLKANRKIPLSDIQKAEEKLKQQQKLIVAFYAQLNKLAAEEHLGTTPTHFVKKMILCDGVVTDSQILTAEGSLAILDFLRQDPLRDALENKFGAPLKYDLKLNSFVTDIKISQPEIISKSVFNYVAENADNKSSFLVLQSMLNSAREHETLRAQRDQLENKKVVLDPFVMSFTVSRINNQIILAYHLPRAGLDAFLKANEKAN